MHLVQKTSWRIVHRYVICVAGISVTMHLGAVNEAIADSDGFHKRMEQGALLSKLGKKQKALEAFQVAVKMKPRNSNAHAELGWALYELGQLDKAIDEEKKAIRFDAKNADAYHHLGSIYLALNRLPEAAQQFRMSLSLDPNKRCNCGPIERLIMTYAPEDKTGAVKGKRKKAEHAKEAQRN